MPWVYTGSSGIRLWPSLGAMYDFREARLPAGSTWYGGSGGSKWMTVRDPKAGEWRFEVHPTKDGAEVRMKDPSGQMWVRSTVFKTMKDAMKEAEGAGSYAQKQKKSPSAGWKKKASTMYSYDRTAADKLDDREVDRYQKILSDVLKDLRQPEDALQILGKSLGKKDRDAGRLLSEAIKHIVEAKKVVAKLHSHVG